MISDTNNKAKLAKIRVAVRIRPPLPREIGSDGRFLSCVGVGPNTDKGQTIFINSSDQPVLLAQSQGSGATVSRYTFDKIFPVNVSQEDVYTYTMEPLVKQVLQGYNATVLAYGQTGSGKTHTILGEKGEREGLAGRTIRALLQNVRNLKMSVLQIYQDSVFDLLSTEAGESLCLRQSHSGVTVEGLSSVVIDSVAKGGETLQSALTRRAVGGTLMNEVSSRSHMIICISVRTEAGLAKLNLVDLAGSERLNESKAEGRRLQETCAINSSLFSLVAVVESLSSSKPFIPYRNSKLTWILSDSIGGNSLTTILAAISPSQKYAKETKSTLKFAHSCKKIEHLVVKNEHKSRNEIDKKVKPLKTEMPWKKNLISVKSSLVETGLGPVCCYNAGRPDGPPVILMHGCPSNFSEFQHFLPCLTYYGFRVIGFDQPGYGSSPGVRANSRSDKAMEKGGPVDVLKEVIKHHNLSQLPTLIGYDWGGGIALTFAVLYPARVNRVISFLPSFSETPNTQLHQLKTPTMILWVKRDQNHSWKHFKGIANKIPGVRIEFVDCPNQAKDAGRNCYENISDNILAPIVDFLGKNELTDEKAVYKTKEITTKSTVGDTVIEICNINFEDDFAPEEIDEMMSRPDPEANAVTLFKNMGLRYGFEELYRAEENHTHKLHKVVTAVFRALPSLNPNTLSNNYENLVHLGIIECLPRGLQEMQRSPRYFPGRKVLIKASELERVYSVDTSAEGGITKIAKGCLQRDTFRELYFSVPSPLE